MKAAILKMVESITKQKQEGKKFPEHVMDLELRAEIMKQAKFALHELRKENKVRFGHSLNHKFIELVPVEKKEK